MDLSDFRADSELQRDGVTIPFGSFTFITIRSASNDKFVSLWNRLKKPYQKEIAADKLTEEIGREILARAISQRLVLGWDFLVIPQKMWAADFPESEIKVIPATHKEFEMEMVEVPYSKKACFEILNHPNYGSFRTWIMLQATELANFQADDFEDDLGN